ncbi:MAG TPA: metalloregulator ArsR/SmtB family transcription factor [Pseudonocardiaceae bacterium]|nr:metalloregulator ArsR/SmtB family transcription factor [Pseudonocardiaceae bacterium]
MVEPLVNRSSRTQALPAQLLQQVAGTFGMLAATARLQIVWLLASGERDVGTLAAEVGSTVPAVSQHLAKLKLAGLVRSRREGRRQVYLVEDLRLADMVTSVVRLHQGRGDLGDAGDLGAGRGA